jgi:hypothetical protein
MLDTGPLLEAVHRLAERFRTMPQSGLRVAVPGFESRAAAGLGLARTLAESGRRLEAPDSAPVPMPDAGGFAVGDQIAVAGHDLAAALDVADRRGARAAGEAGAGEAARALDDALRDVAATLRLIG